MSLTEGTRAGEFVISEGNGAISREEVTLITGQNLAAGTLLGKITTGGKYTAYDNGASDGSQAVAGILYDNVDATDADKTVVIIARDAEVSSALLTGSDANGVADMLALNIIVR
jgi:hypothetical protein